MWTPRRLLLLLFGFAICFGAYEVYAFFLGHYDGLPPLPMEYRANGQTAPSGNSEDPYRDRKHEIEKLLELAFGPKCQELYRSRNLEIGKPESRTVLAFEEWTLEQGILRLAKVSMANFKKIPARDKQPERLEIFTIQGETAYIKFSHPINNPWEIKPHVKPVAGHIEGEDIKLTHNHGTPEKNDDVTVYCKKRVDFVDEQHRIWSDGKVLVVYAEPPEARFEGVGLEITLLSDLIPPASNPKGSKPPPRQEPGPGLSSVKTIRLDHDVEFNFLKVQGSFLGATPANPSDKKPEGTGQPMVIRCKDAFTYDAQTHTATFQNRVNGLRYRSVTTAEGPKQQYDELDADEKLVLTLVPPRSDDKDKKTTSAEDEVKQFQLKKAVATGKRVKLTANEDGTGGGLHAEGIELICDNEKHEARLKGNPQVVARIRNGGKDYDIFAQGVVKVLLPEGNEQDKDPRALIIEGPGEVRTRATPEQPDPYTVATWQQEMQWHRSPEEQRIELLGAAVFMHEKHGRMAGDSIKAWLTPAPKKEQARPNALPAGEKTLDAKLKRIELDKRVSVLSTKLVVPRANRLHLTFTESPSNFVPQPRGRDGWDTSTPQVSPGQPGQPGIASQVRPAETPPLYLKAGDIDGDIYVVNDKQQVVHRLEARDNVHVERKPDLGKANGLDIRGQRLEMTAQGNTDLYRFRLFGNKASLQTDKFGLEGMQIDLDQAENRVTVPGAGKFRFLTDRDFQGNDLRRITTVQIYWDDKMEFGGRVANFQGGILAEQDEKTVRCHTMTITLDRTLSLASRDADFKQPVGIESAICVSDQTANPEQRANPVVIEQRINPGLPDRSILRIEGVQVVFDNAKMKYEFIKVYGPGEVNLVRAGKAQLMPPPGPAPAKPATTAPTAAQPAASVLKLTRVLFEGEAEYRKNDGVLRFWKNVKFFHVPGDDIMMQLNPKKLPKDGFYVESDMLDVASVSGENSTVLHEVTAEGNVLVQLNASSNIKCDKAYYNELKGQVIMEGSNGNDALWYFQDKPGGAQKVQRAKAFIYYQKTGEVKVIDAKSLQVR